MSIETRFIRGLLEWLCLRYPFLCMDVVVGPGYHRHKNGKRKKVTG